MCIGYDIPSVNCMCECMIVRTCVYAHVHIYMLVFLSVSLAAVGWGESGD